MSYEFIRGDATQLPLADSSVDLVVTSPPPPPDPADVVAMWLTGRPHPAEEFLARLRDLFTTDALESAAAKVQEAEG